MEITEFIEPTKASRIKLASIWLTGAIIIACTDYFWASLMGHINSLPLCSQLPWLQTILIAGFLLLLFASAIFARHAHKVLSSNQTPVPGTLVFFRTPIKRGSKTKFEAYAAATGAILFLAASFYLPMWSWPTISPISITPTSCAGVNT